MPLSLVNMVIFSLVFFTIKRRDEQLAVYWLTIFNSKLILISENHKLFRNQQLVAMEEGCPSQQCCNIIPISHHPNTLWS